jgi:hypothetical protein
MSDNPLEMTPEREQRIRERAYALWQSEGEVHGRELDYWERARELVGMQESAGAGQVAPPDPDDPLPGVVVDEASIQENLGEFPDRSSDQGDWTQTPMTRDQLKASREPDAQPTRGDAP